MAPLISILCILGSYGLGSLSAGLWFAHRAGVDLRAIGSGNIGAANVGRALGRRAELWVLVLDALKGTLATSLFGLALLQLGHDPLVATAAGVAAVAGHCFPFYAPTQGGKGVATSLGVILAFSPSTAAIAVLSYITVRRSSQLPSLAALIATAIALVASVWLSPSHTLPIALLAAMIVLRHEDNLRRLLAGTELGGSESVGHPQAGSTPHQNAAVDPKDRA